jgi:hypothetical protein
VSISNLDAGTAVSQGFRIVDPANGYYNGLGGQNYYDTPNGRHYPIGSAGLPSTIGMTDAGDVNGDGLNDFIVSENAAGTTNLGRAFVLFGTTDNRTNISLPDMSTNPASISYGFFINGSSTFGTGLGNEFGTVVGGGGDVNGDGFSDLIVSTTQGLKAGSAFVVFGKTDGNTLNVSSLTATSNTSGFRIVDAIEGVTSLYADATPKVQIIGDVNGDGLADVAVAQNTRTVVVFGKADGSSVSVSAIAAGSSSEGFVIKGASDTAMGYMTNAGDMNGDGLDDMAITTSTTHGYIVFGQTGSATIDLTTPDATKFVNLANEGASLAQSSMWPRRTPPPRREAQKAAPM